MIFGLVLGYILNNFFPASPCILRVYQCISPCYLHILNEPRVKTFRFPLSAEYWRHCVLSGGTQRGALHRYQSEEMKILNISYSLMGI